MINDLAKRRDAVAVTQIESRNRTEPEVLASYRHYETPRWAGGTGLDSMRVMVVVVAVMR